ncbi:MAG: sporulation protein [Lachnospiraceae bacterium]|nr:sporulation protein [Lachnospiraceae bacterium]
MAERKGFPGVVESLLQGMESVLSAKTVVGQPVQVGDVTILPLVDVSFGFAAGAGNHSDKNSARNGGGLGGKMSPSAVLIIKDGATRLVSVKDQSTMTKLLDLLPDLVDKFTGKKEMGMEDTEAVDIAFPDREA